MYLTKKSFIYRVFGFLRHLQLHSIWVVQRPLNQRYVSLFFDSFDAETRDNDFLLHQFLISFAYSMHFICS